jgi:hypothetical protein
MARFRVVQGGASQEPRNIWKYIGIAAVIAIVVLFAVPKVLDMAHVSINFGAQTNNVTGGNNGNNGNNGQNDANEPGTRTMYKALNGNYFSPENQETMGIVTPAGYEMRPSSSEDSQIATSDWLSSVRDFANNQAWRRGGNQNEDMMNTFVSAMEANNVRYDRKKAGNSYTIKMPLWMKGNTLRAVEVTVNNIGDVKFDDPDKLSDIYPASSNTGNTGGNSGSTGGNSGSTGGNSLYNTADNGSSGSGSLYA